MDTPQEKKLVQVRVTEQLHQRLLRAVFTLKVERGDSTATNAAVVTQALTEWLDRNGF